MKTVMVWTCRERMLVDRIPHRALHARYEGKRNRGRPRLQCRKKARLKCTDNINQDITSLGEQWTWLMNKDNADILFIPIAAWKLASERDADDDNNPIPLYNPYCKYSAPFSALVSWPFCLINPTPVFSHHIFMWYISLIRTPWLH